jgi:hypothetical protein
MRRGVYSAYIVAMLSNLQTVKKLLSLPRPLALEIVDFRFQNRISSESEAMRRLLAEGLKAAAQSPVRRSSVQ